MFEPETLGQRKDELAAALREARRQAGLTGDRLAARCGISQSKISKIETGKVLPSATDVARRGEDDLAGGEPGEGGTARQRPVRQADLGHRRRCD